MRKMLGLLLSCFIVLTGCNQAQKGSDRSLEIFHYKETITSGLDKIASAYMSTHSDVKISTQVLGTDYNTVLKTKDSAGKLPDIFAASTPGEKALTPYIRGGKIADVSSLSIIKKLPEGVKESITFSDGKIYVIPLLNTARGIIYNEELLKKAGITEFPKTLQEMEFVCQKLKQAGITPFAGAGKEGWTLGSTIFQPGHEVFASPTFSAQRDNKEISFANDMLPIFGFIDLYLENVQEKFLDTDYIGSVELYSLEQAAMIVQGPWVINTVEELNKEVANQSRMGAIPFKETDNRLYYDFDAYFCVSSQADLEIVEEFFNYIVEGEGKAIFQEEIKAINPYGIKYEMNKVDRDIDRYVSEGNTISDTQYINMPDGFWNVFAIGMQEYATGKISQEEMLIQFDKEWDAMTEE